MKLDRNSPDGRGKYAIINLRKLAGGGMSPAAVGRAEIALEVLQDLGVLEYGPPGSDQEFFVIKLRDRFARKALRAYADAARFHDGEYADDVDDLAHRAGIGHPHWKDPD